MDIKLIEDLVALRQHGSFVRAAEARHVTHPAFGRRVRALETWAGVPLVARGRAPVRPTPAGEYLLGEAGPLLAGLARVRAVAQHAQPRPRQHDCVLIMPTLVHASPGATLVRFARQP
jgi:DNA-binding transcriptional LysR family regulator